MLRQGLEASDLGAEGEKVAQEIEARLRTGRPLAAEAWITEHEEALHRKLAPARRGRKPKTAAVEN